MIPKTLNLVAIKKPGMDKEYSLKKSVRRDIDENMALEINYVDKIERSVSGKHRFVISNLKDHQLPN